MPGDSYGNEEQPQTQQQSRRLTNRWMGQQGNVGGVVDRSASDFFYRDLMEIQLEIGRFRMDLFHEEQGLLQERQLANFLLDISYEEQ